MSIRFKIMMLIFLWVVIMNEKRHSTIFYFSSPLKTLFDTKAAIMILPLFIILVMNINIKDMILIFVKIYHHK